MAGTLLQRRCSGAARRAAPTRAARPRVHGARAIALAILVAVSLGACGGALAQGKAEFRKGRYAEASQTLAGLEAESRRWDDTRRAEYALYRGLTLGALGDRAAALVWLSEAKALEAARPGLLGADDLTRLKLALEALAVEPTGAGLP